MTVKTAAWRQTQALAQHGMHSSVNGVTGPVIATTMARLAMAAMVASRLLSHPWIHILLARQCPALALVMMRVQMQMQTRVRRVRGVRRQKTLEECGQGARTRSGVQ